MKPRVSDQLKAQGCTADVADFRATLAAIKAELFPDISTEELTFTRDEAGEFCQAVRKRLGAPRLSRVFLLRALTGIRKNGKKARPAAEVAATDASATPSTAS